MADRGGEAGSATVLGAAFIAVLVTVAVGAAALGSAVVARHRAQAAADLAALAAAAALPLGPEAACGRAAAVAHAMSAGLRDCGVRQLDAVVGVGVAVRLGRWDLGVAQSVARAGPVH